MSALSIYQSLESAFGWELGTNSSGKLTHVFFLLLKQTLINYLHDYWEVKNQEKDIKLYLGIVIACVLRA